MYKPVRNRAWYPLSLDNVSKFRRAWRGSRLRLIDVGVLLHGHIESTSVPTKTHTHGKPFVQQQLEHYHAPWRGRS